MTKKEAINILKIYTPNRIGIISKEFWDALEIVIAALESDNNEPD